MESVELRGLLPSLPFLVALADTGQVTAAADLLRLPQPTVTRGLQRLERELGVTLVEKAGRGIRLTPAGEALVPFARESLRQAAAGVAAVRAPVRGVVSIAFQNMLGQDLVPALIRGFLSENPQVDFALQQGARQLCLDALRSGRADCALLSPLPSGPEYDVIDLGADELVVVVGPEHQLAHRRTVRIPELGAERFVVLGRDFGLRETVDALFAEAGIAPEVAYEAQDIHTMVGLASAGLGVAIVPRRAYAVPVVALTIRGMRAERRVGAATWVGGRVVGGAGGAGSLGSPAGAGPRGATAPTSRGATATPTAPTARAATATGTATTVRGVTEAAATGRGVTVRATDEGTTATVTVTATGTRATGPGVATTGTGATATTTTGIEGAATSTAAGAFVAFVRRSGPAIAGGILARRATAEGPRPIASVGGSH